MASKPKLWVYKTNANYEDYQTFSGDWTTAFQAFNRDKKAFKWGGSSATKRPDGKRIFLEELRVGDLLLCWQTDKRSAVGVTRVASFKMEGVENWLFLDVVDVFNKPIKLHELKRTTHQELLAVDALRPGNLKTIYSTTCQEAFWLLGACGSNQSRHFKSAI